MVGSWADLVGTLSWFGGGAYFDIFKIVLLTVTPVWTVVTLVFLLIGDMLSLVGFHLGVVQIYFLLFHLQWSRNLFLETSASDGRHKAKNSYHSAAFNTLYSQFFDEVSHLSERPGVSSFFHNVPYIQHALVWS